MGVHGLWRLLESSGKPVNPETLEGKVLAVDISIWLNQAVKGVRDRHGNSVQNAHLLTLFHRVCKLLFFRIRPVFVFDGDAPLLKKQTLALRRQRKEDLSRESKQTNEKLLKTFLKRQAIKAALGDRSQDPLPSLSSVRRDEVDDMYVLPALPPAEEKDKNSSEEEEEREQEETMDNYHMYQGELHGNPNTVDINSEHFSSLPPEMKHEILKDMKEFSKRRRTMYHKPPEQSGDFSQYQLAGLLQRNKLNQRLEGVEREMSQRSAGCAPDLHQQDGDQQSHSVESRRLMSEDYSHYILIKGSKKSETKSETAVKSQPAAAPWSGGPLSGSRTRGADRPEPLWRPVSEEEEAGGPSYISRPSLYSQKDTSPPSPRTLRAIQAAMSDISEEEEEEEEVHDKRGGDMSPRTLLAIQQALMEDDYDGPAGSGSQAHLQHLVPQVVISSEEEKEADDEPKITHSLTSDHPKVQGNIGGQSHVRDNLLVSSSEDEIEEVIEQRNTAPHSATLLQPQDTERGETTETRSRRQDGTERRDDSERREAERRPTTEKLDHEEDQHQEAVVPDQKTQSIHSPARIHGTTPSTEHKTEMSPLMPEQKSEESIEILEERNGDVKEDSSKESESEESFIEVSGDEFEEEDASNSHTATGRGAPGEMYAEGTKREDEDAAAVGGGEESPDAALKSEEEEDKSGQNEEEEEQEEEETETDSRPAAAPNEWEDIDVDELEALESDLQAQQSSLREQKQQQERMATTVTGQMYLESQELLRLFGVPFLVAPTEAEAQCAALDRADQTHGTITDDSDVWLFGGRHVYKNFFSQNKFVEHYQYSDLQNQLGLDRTKMVNLAYLLGSDYTEGVPGVGYVTGMEVLNEFPGPGLEPLTQFSKWWSEAQEHKRLVSDPRDSKVKKKLRSLQLQPGFPNPAVAQAYMHPSVDESDSSLSWGRPQLDLIKEFCLSRFGWSSRKTDETLQPVIKQLNSQQTQLRIDSFFRMEQQEKQAIRSQRLRRAVICMKRKEREGGEEEDWDGSEEEDEVISPIKSKKGKATSQSQSQRSGGEGQGDGAGGGFLGSELIFKSPVTPLKDVGRASQRREPPSARPQVTPQPKSQPQPQHKPQHKPQPQPQPQLQPEPALHRRRSSSSSSSDGDGDNTGDVAMVTARSVFEGNRRGRGTKQTRGRGRGRGKKVQGKKCGVKL
ncbi:DNA excision repair protein ERCC-5 [Genypterus blacodes]|uniref:DNA excision repair protein ERCC-5 n=1 Tax=Genypterus blacodes TaxID=154954 RepID=UPI003F769909